MAKSYRNRRGQIVEPKRGKRKVPKTDSHASPLKVVSNSAIRVEVAFHEERQELGVGVFLGGHGHAIPATEAEEMSQTFIVWLSMCDAPRVEFPLEGESYSVDREGAIRLAVLLGEHATVVAMLEALAVYEMESGGLDRRAALRAVGEFYKFARVPRGVEGPRQLAARARTRSWESAGTGQPLLSQLRRMVKKRSSVRVTPPFTPDRSHATSWALRSGPPNFGV